MRVFPSTSHDSSHGSPIDRALSAWDKCLSGNVLGGIVGAPRRSALKSLRVFGMERDDTAESRTAQADGHAIPAPSSHDLSHGSGSVSSPAASGRTRT